jgi:small subunit ribosomal protein YMR-31
MNTTKVLRQVAAAQAVTQQRVPLIKFVGKRTAPESTDHTPQAHPASPSRNLPDSFAAYRQNAQQHGPLNHRTPSSTIGGAIGGQSGQSLGPVEPPKGQYFDRDELPEKFRRKPWTQAEIDAVQTGGASLFT